ncbi:MULTISPECIES: ferredoxin [Rhizobium]|uniref:Ferredoxin n=4 Tax=Rhizobium TaxID=379 RepID=A0A7W9CYF1_9HYPH|nr:MULTISPECIES: ferredoxin [Rhizobium]EJT01249.1 ferredoxin protein [Rhizobium sp. CCGE 510]MBB4577404.1 ferredoxin [Rhizobium lentis]MBB5564478.1 ferredoxin [Rhizobium lentis]MBB5570911.1 ferredoxin [Rhizobium lentis]
MEYRMRIIVHTAKCQGHARCWAQAPEIFNLDDEGYILPGAIDVEEKDELFASRGARSCPERALEIDCTSDALLDRLLFNQHCGG